jgi:hypothetical protein
MITAFESYVELHWLSWVFLAILGALGWLVANVIARPLLEFWSDRREAIQVLRTQGGVAWGASEDRVKTANAAIRQAAAQMLFYAEGGPIIVRLYSKARGYKLRLAGLALQGLATRIGESFTEDGTTLQSDGVRVCLGATGGMNKSRQTAIRHMLIPNISDDSGRG